MVEGTANKISKRDDYERGRGREKEEWMRAQSEEGEISKGESENKGGRGGAGGRAEGCFERNTAQL